MSPPPSEEIVPIGVYFPRASISSASISAKDFDLEEEDQEMMRRLLLLSELRKITKVIDRFSSKPPEIGADVGRAGDIYTMLGMWLRKELDHAMQHIKPKS